MDSKNIDIGCIYKHSCMQQSEFNYEYLKPHSEKLISENKEVKLLGDFNINLLKCDSEKFSWLSWHYTVHKSS